MRAPAEAPSPARKSPSVTEYVLVMAMMGTLGLVAVPAAESTEVELEGAAFSQGVQTALIELRDGLIAYRRDHAYFPGYLAGVPMRRTHGSITQQTLRDQLECRSDVWGNTIRILDSRFPFGPYLVYGIPENPVNGLDTVRMLGDLDEFPAAPDGETGWIYQPLTGEIRANCSGRLPHGGESFYDL